MPQLQPPALPKPSSKRPLLAPRGVTEAPIMALLSSLSLSYPSLLLPGIISQIGFCTQDFPRLWGNPNQYHYSITSPSPPAQMRTKSPIPGQHWLQAHLPQLTSIRPHRSWQPMGHRGEGALQATLAPASNSGSEPGERGTGDLGDLICTGCAAETCPGGRAPRT